MKLARVEIENYRAIEKLDLPLDPRLTVLHGDNGHGKTSVLSAIATGLGSIPEQLTDVSSVRFLQSDRRGSRQLRVGLTTVDGIAWERRVGGPQKRNVLRELKEVVEAIVKADREGTGPLHLPIVAFYDTDRAVFDSPQRRRGFITEFPRYRALQGALSARTDFRDFFQWFYAKENEELREQKEQGNFDYQLKDLQSVRSAIEAMLPGVSQPRIKLHPLRFVVSQVGDGNPEQLSINQLSGGYRIMLALAADLARRMAQGNPHLDDPLQSEAIVLIDEVELHLHPSWQQRILGDLARTFPNTQFIVSTHSPQVLTTVKPECIVELRREQDAESWPARPLTRPMVRKRAMCLQRSWGWTNDRAATSLQSSCSVTRILLRTARVSPRKASACGKSWTPCHRAIPHLTEPTSRSGGANCSGIWASPDEAYPETRRAYPRPRGLSELCWRTSDI